MAVLTTTQADERGIAIVEPLTVVDTVEGPYLGTGDYDIVAPPEIGSAPAAKKLELDRWAGTRGYVPVPGTNHYRHI